jgi:heterotetrameric sarcosine oxidase gamma subunit
MAERRGALADLAAEAGGSAVNSLREILPGSIVQIQAWPDSLERMRSMVADISGAAAPAIGHAFVSGHIAIAATAPGRFLLTSEASDLPERLSGALTAADGTVTDLSHGRSLLRLEGPGAEAILQKCVAVDLDPAAFPTERAAQTMMHHIDVLIVRRAETIFDLFVLRSFAEALAEWLLDAGVEGGVSFQR